MYRIFPCSIVIGRPESGAAVVHSNLGIFVLQREMVEINSNKNRQVTITEDLVTVVTIDNTFADQHALIHADQHALIHTLFT